MGEFVGIKTNDGKEIYSSEFVENMRKEIDSGAVKNVFVPNEGAQETDLHTDVDILITGGNRGGGKANTCSTPVATPSGFRKLGELEVGDLICTPYNGVQKVSAIYEQGENTIYHFYFDDGTNVACMDNHRFFARTNEFEKFHEMTAREIMNHYRIDAPYPLSLRCGCNDFVEIPLCGEVEMNESITDFDLPIDPFTLGYISRKGYFWFERFGVNIGENLMTAQCFLKAGYLTRINRRNGCYYIKNIPNEIRRQFTRKRTKVPAYIPDKYMTACIEARWEYLRGVMFAGQMKNSHPYITMPNRKLIEQIAQMARSLGIWVSVTQEKDEPDRIGYWKATFVAPHDDKLFPKKCYRKNCKIHGEWPTKPNAPYTMTKKILFITKSKIKQNCRCITVTGRDHLYLTDAYTINHNTVTLLMENMYDIKNKYSSSVIFRKNKDDFKNIITESKRWFSRLGFYNRSKDDMTWNFKSGATLSFDHFDMTPKDFDEKYRGQQISYIGIDEVTQMPFEYFKTLMKSNRNTVGLRSRIVGTCNPDPLSWVRIFIDWWIGKADTIYSDGKTHPERKGYIIPERDGVVRYCYMPGDTVDSIVWGDTPQDVYEQCREQIDDAWDPALESLGYDKTTFAIKSVTFVKASIEKNRALLKSDPNYVASILNQPPEIRAREWDGNWDVIRIGNDIIQAFHMDKVFQNAQMRGDNVRRATCDVAGDGGDNCVTWFWIGWHVADVYVCQKDAFTTIGLVSAKLKEWGVLEENFAYDLNGMGQVFKGAFPKAVRFNNQEAVALSDKYLYDNKKSQCAYRFAERTHRCEWSIEPNLLTRKYKMGKDTRELRDILQLERKCIRQDLSKTDKGWCLIRKDQMKQKALVGHSPDFFEALFMREIFEIKHTQAVIPQWLQGGNQIRTVRKIVSHRL